MALLIPAMMVAIRSRVIGTTEAALATGVALAGLIHTALSVQQRYHLIYLPFIVLLIGIAANSLSERFKPNRPAGITSGQLPTRT